VNSSLFVLNVFVVELCFQCFYHLLLSDRGPRSSWNLVLKTGDVTSNGVGRESDIDNGNNHEY